MTAKSPIGRASELVLDGAISAKIPGMTSKRGDQLPVVLSLGQLALSTTAQTGTYYLIPFDCTVVGGVAAFASSTATNMVLEIGTSTATNSILSAYALATTGGALNFTTSLATGAGALTLSQGTMVRASSPIGTATGNVSAVANLILVPRN